MKLSFKTEIYKLICVFIYKYIYKAEGRTNNLDKCKGNRYTTY